MAGDQAEGNVHFRGTQGVTVYSMGHYWWPLMHRVFGCLDFPKPVSGRGVSHWNDKVDVSAGLSAVKHVRFSAFMYIEVRRNKYYSSLPRELGISWVILPYA